MNRLEPPRFDGRRRKDLRDELVGRARGWLPEWRRSDGGDFAAAIFEIAARLSSEVTERLDRVPEKAFRGFLDWLGVRGQAGRAARLPVVFTMAAGSEPVAAAVPVQFQANEADPPVTFETEQPLTIVPGALASIVMADPPNDAFYRPPAGFSALEAPPAVPNRWRVKATAPIGATQIQIEPELGADDLPTLVHMKSRQQYRVAGVEGGIVSIDPPVGQVERIGSATPPAPMPLTVDDELTRLTSFASFDDGERNRQEHALYLGSEALLNIKAPARIGVEGGATIPAEAPWFYWGKRVPQDKPAWLSLRREPGDGLVLEKAAGQFEILEIDGKPSRWLRATTGAGASVTRQTLSQLKLTVNCNRQSPTCAPNDPPSTVAIEAIANTTPVVLDIPFYPLGREPRLFDAFYLAAPEAFSKKNAFVEICFQLADGTTEGYSAARLGTGAADPLMLFGVGKDGNLHRLRPQADTAHPFQRLAPVRPPFSENGTTVIPAPSSPLNQLPHARLATVSRATTSDALVAVTSKLDAWIWQQMATPTGSRWYRAGPIWDTDDGPIPVPTSVNLSSVIVMHEGTGGLRLVGLYEGNSYHASLPDGWEGRDAPKWTRVAPKPSNDETRPDEEWVQIAPIFSLDGRLTGADAANGWLAAGAAGLAMFTGGKLIRLTDIGEVSTTVAPLGLKLDDDKWLVVVQQAVSGPDPIPPSDQQVVAWIVTADDGALEAEKQAVDNGLEVFASFDWSGSSVDDLAIVYCGREDEDTTVIATWRPLTGREPAAEEIPSARSEDIDALNGAPGVVDHTIVTSGAHAEIVVVDFHPERAQGVSIPLDAIEEAWLISGTSTPFLLDDVLTIGSAGDRMARRVTQAPEASVGDFFFRHDFGDDSPAEGTIKVFRPVANAKFDGKLRNQGRELVLDDDDTLAGEGAQIVVGDDDALVQCKMGPILPITQRRAHRVTTLSPRARGTGTTTYAHVSEEPSRDFVQRPTVELAELTPDAIAALQAPAFEFEGATPVQQLGRFHPPGPSRRYAGLAFGWDDPPTRDPARIIMGSVFDPARILSEPRTVNPQLSWEYWDGTAWWTIKGLVDGTVNFLFSGKVSFCVPSTLQPTDVVGRTSHWIRARLVGGDYGRESVTITSVPVEHTSPQQTKQTIDRSLEDIVAPQVVSVNLYYSVCCASLPDFVLTKDGGAIRDQSSANRTKEASLELFVPLAETIGRAGGALPPADPTATSPQASSPDTRALYLGFDEEVTGEPLSILFLIQSRDRDDAYPLEVDVLRGRRFEPVSLSGDGTRGLNETGVLTVTLSTPPQRATLFGDSRHWIRIRPNRRSDAGRWKPNIRAAYLNATWAKASNTQADEVLGSSDGSPKQRVFLARLPILFQSLKLRVREPLGGEEIEQLRKANPDLVKDELNRRPGPWVLWQEVADPSDSGPKDRVYALDDENGAITFGDGAHGKIPPPGQDAIVAEQYKQGGGAAANAIGAWSQINLITPLQGVERVVVPEGAAGGSDPQDGEAVIQFAPANLSIRDRALTLRDLEVLGLQFSPDIAQVRALGTGSSVKLVVVARGSDPRPARAVLREIVPYLVEHGAPGLAEKDAMVAVEPTIVSVRMNLRLEISAIEDSGTVAREVAARLTALLDPAAGGLDQSGWRLGDRIVEQDVAAALDGVAGLETIVAVRIEQQNPDGTASPLPAQLRPADLLQLAPDGVEIESALANAEALA